MLVEQIFEAGAVDTTQNRGPLPLGTNVQSSKNRHGDRQKANRYGQDQRKHGASLR